MKKIFRALICAVLISALISANAYADWYDDVKSGCTWVEIKGDGFVADTFCGVEARYNESDYYYQCNELIMRFYAEAFGLDVLAYSNTGLIMLSEGYAFAEADKPKKGDIIFVSAAMRNSSSDHWAIVKDYGNGYITMFEQNVVWDGKAAVNRQIEYPSDSYYLFTPVSTGSAPAPTLSGAEEETTEKTTVEVKTTEVKPVSTTSAPKPSTTAKKSETTAAETTAVRTTAAKTTALMSTTAESKTVPVSATETATTAEASTAYTYYSFSQYSKYITETAGGEPETEKSDSGGKSTAIIASACGALLLLIIAITVNLIKKKK
ncbi:MAG: CHAP domain-containing protein [Acutalibacteraceae bacterium]